MSHRLFCLKISANIPSALPVIRPKARRAGAIYFVFSPKIISLALKICAALFASAPARLMPTALIFDLKILLVRIIANAEKKEPAAEKIKTYEKSVPEIIDCAKTLKSTIKAISRFLKKESERIIGRFASPRRRKGSGFGTAYSIAERKRQSAEKKVISFVRSFFLS